MSVRWLSFALAFGAACGGTGTEARPDAPDAFVSTPSATDAGANGTVGTSSGLPCDVDRVLSASCRKCHSSPPQFGAPMPLVDHDDLHAAAPSGGKKVFEMAAFKIAHDAAPMPPPPNARLSQADRKVLTDWAAAGAPRSDDTCAPAPPPAVDPVTGLGCTPDRTLAPSVPYELPDTVDQYVCWGVEVTADAPTHIVGFAPRVDNTRMVHHVVMFESPEAYPTTPQPCAPTAAVTWRILLAWAPGTGGIELPPEAGFPIAKAGMHYIVQMHYSNPQRLKGEKDASSIALCTTPPRKFEADVLAFGAQSFTIPAAPPKDGAYTLDCSVTVPRELAGIHLFTALPHMHQAGVGIKTTLARKEGGPELDLGTMPSFDYTRQTWLPINATVREGDTVRTVCDWKNTTGTKISFGEKTADEMCYSFTMYYPRISSPLWSWAFPAGVSQCQSGD